MSSLNEMLLEYPGLETSACESFNLTDLLGIQRTLFHARNPALQRIYAEAKDNRELRYTSLTELDAAQREQHAAAGSNQHLVSMMRDGLCHELVLAFAHLFGYSPGLQDQWSTLPVRVFRLRALVLLFAHLR